MRNFSSHSIIMSSMLVAAAALCDCQPAFSQGTSLDSIEYAETPDQIAGNYESQRDPDVAVTRIPMPSLMQVTSHTFEAQYASYLQREAQSQNQFQECREKKNCAPLVMAWLRLVDELNKSQMAATTKMSIEYAWINEGIAYNYKKGSKIQPNSPDWYQTSFETTSTGEGECGDVAWLRHATGLATHFEDQNMRVLVGTLYTGPAKTPFNHLEFMVNVDGHNYILNDELTYIDPNYKPTESPTTFVPLVAENMEALTYYKVELDKKNRYQLPVDKKVEYHPKDLVSVCVADSCFYMHAGETGADIFQRLIQEAHDLNPKRSHLSTPTRSTTVTP